MQILPTSDEVSNEIIDKTNSTVPVTQVSHTESNPSQVKQKKILGKLRALLSINDKYFGNCNFRANKIQAKQKRCSKEECYGIFKYQKRQRK